MERNIKLLLEYEGTAYAGWQYQKDQVTLQQTLETAILKLTGEEIRVTASGRTDAGVHARGQVVNFKLQKNLPLDSIRKGLNFYLPDDVSVTTAAVAEPDFHARFDAKKRIYQYYITTQHTALSRQFCWQLFQKFDETLLNPLANTLLGHHDFGAFCRVQVQSEHKRCTVHESHWFREKNFWVYRVAANRFLHGMVRTIVGTIIDTALGKFTTAQFREIFQSGNRLLAGPAAPAKGLVLEQVLYE